MFKKLETLSKNNFVFILRNTLVLQEAKDSSEVENIVTTQDELYKADLDFGKIPKNVIQKEVLRYREAMGIGFSFVRSRSPEKKLNGSQVFGFADRMAVSSQGEIEEQQLLCQSIAF